MDIKVFEEETRQACLRVGGESLRAWIEKNGGTHPILAREDAGLSNSDLDDNQYYSFAWAFSGEPKIPGEDNEYFDLGLKFRELTLAGEFDALHEKTESN